MSGSLSDALTRSATGAASRAESEAPVGDDSPEQSMTALGRIDDAIGDDSPEESASSHEENTTVSEASVTASLETASGGMPPAAGNYTAESFAPAAGAMDAQSGNYTTFNVPPAAGMMGSQVGNYTAESFAPAAGSVPAGESTDAYAAFNAHLNADAEDPYAALTRNGMAALSADDDDLEFSLSDSSSEEEGPSTPRQPVAQPRQYARVDTEQSATGMKAKSVGAEYHGEHNQAAWRGGTPELRGRTNVVTRLYNDEEQRQNELVMGPDGGFTKGGRGVANAKLGYAMDASGRMVAFDENKDTRLITTGWDGVARVSEATNATGVLTGDRMLPANQRLEAAHHATVLGGDVVTDEDGNPVMDTTGRPVMRSRPAASAGFMEFDVNGKIVKISNASGHYKPTVDYLMQGIEHLLKQGAFFTNEVVDGDGQPLQPRSKEGQLYRAMQAKVTEAGALAERIAGLTEALAKAEQQQNAKAQAAIAGNLEALRAELDALNKRVNDAKAVLNKLGVGPANRVNPGARAEYIDVQAGMDGADVRKGKMQSMPVQDFLASGGGNTAQAANKAQVGQEIVGRGQFTRSDFDMMQELGARNPNELSAADARKLADLRKKFEAARQLHMANKEAEDRAARVAAATGDTSLKPGAVEEALAGLGGAPAEEADADPSSESELEDGTSSPADGDESAEYEFDGNYQRQ
jgi:hypothetical protein